MPDDFKRDLGAGYQSGAIEVCQQIKGFDRPRDASLPAVLHGWDTKRGGSAGMLSDRGGIMAVNTGYQPTGITRSQGMTGKSTICRSMRSSNLLISFFPQSVSTGAPMPR